MDFQKFLDRTIVDQLREIERQDNEYSAEARRILYVLRSISEATFAEIQRLMEDSVCGIVGDPHHHHEVARSIARRHNQTRVDEQMRAAGELIQRFIVSLS